MPKIKGKDLLGQLDAGFGYTASGVHAEIFHSGGHCALSVRGLGAMKIVSVAEAPDRTHASVEVEINGKKRKYEVRPSPIIKREE